MSITLGDSLKHNNPIFPIADIEDIKGGTRTIATFSNTDLYNAFNGIPDKLKQNYTNLIVTNTNQHYYLSGTNATITTSWTLTGSGFSGSGTTNSVVKWNGSTSLGDSLITDNGDTVTINGNLTIIGTSSSISSQNLIIKDPIILLAGSQSTPQFDAGLFVNRGTGDTQAFIWDESATEFKFISTTSSSTTLGNISIGTYSSVRTGPLSIQGATSGIVNFIDSTNVITGFIDDFGRISLLGDYHQFGVNGTAEIKASKYRTQNYGDGFKDVADVIHFVSSNNGIQGWESKGTIVYQSDYSSGYTDRTLIDKAYSDSSSVFYLLDGTINATGKTSSIYRTGSLNIGTGIVSNSRFVVSSTGGTLSLVVNEQGDTIFSGDTKISGQTFSNLPPGSITFGGKTAIYSPGESQIVIGAARLLDYNYNYGWKFTDYKIENLYNNVIEFQNPMGTKENLWIGSNYIVAGYGESSSQRSTLFVKGTTSSIMRVVGTGATWSNSASIFEINNSGVVSIGSSQSIIGTKLFIQSSTSSTTIGSNVMLDLYNGDNTGSGYLSEISFSSQGQAFASIPYDVRHRYAIISGYANTWNNITTGGGIKFSTRNGTGESLVTALVVSENGSVYNASRGSNTLYGLDAISSTYSTGINNTAVGYQSLYNNTTGDSNSAFGVSSLYSNTATGYITATLIVTDAGSGYTASSTFSNVQLSYISGSTANIYPIVTVYVGSTSSVSTVTVVSTGSGFKDLTTVMGANLGSGVTFSVKLSFIATGFNNTAAGYQSLLSNTSGNNNNSIGYQSMYYNTIGYQNTAIGSNSLYSNTTGNHNTAMGYESLFTNTSTLGPGFPSLTGLGTITGGSGYTNGTYSNVNLIHSSGSTAISYPTGVQIVVSGGSVTSVTLGINFGAGFKDFSTIMTAPASSLGGSGTGFSVGINNIIAPRFNTAVGTRALYSNKSASYNTAVGGYALSSSVVTDTSNQNFPSTAIGYGSLSSNTTGRYNSALGYVSLGSNTTGEGNVAIGHSTLAINSIYSYNTAVGHVSMYNNRGNQNTSIGAFSLYTNTTGSFNTALGQGSMQNSIDGSYNTALGFSSLVNLNTGGSFGLSSYNTALGGQALFNTTTGSYNTAVGNNSFFWNKAGSYNTGIGYQSLNFANSGNYNTALGNNSLYKNNKGDYNVAIGKGALNWNTSIISTLAATFSPGSNYTPGTYSGIPLNYKSGPDYYPGTLLEDFPLADIIVGPGGTVSSVTLTNGGSVVHDTSIVLGVWENGYSPYGLPILPGVGGSGFRINIASVTPAGTYNTALGVHSLYNVRTGSNNVALGSYAGSNSNLVNASASVYIGYNANSTSLNVSNEIVIGYGATGSGSNSVTLGASTITKTQLRGTINIGSVPPYNNNSEAITGGLVPGDIYRTPITNVLMVVV